MTLQFSMLNVKWSDLEKGSMPIHLINFHFIFRLFSKQKSLNNHEILIVKFESRISYLIWLEKWNIFAFSQIAKELAKAGMIVCGLAKRKDKVEALRVGLLKIKGQLNAVECDVANEQSVNQAFGWIEKTFGGIDLLINNGGVYSKFPNFASNWKLTETSSLSQGFVHWRKQHKRFKADHWHEFDGFISVYKTSCELNENSRCQRSYREYQQYLWPHSKLKKYCWESWTNFKSFF